MQNVKNAVMQNDKYIISISELIMFIYIYIYIPLHCIAFYVLHYLMNKYTYSICNVVINFITYKILYTVCQTERNNIFSIPLFNTPVKNNLHAKLPKMKLFR